MNKLIENLLWVAWIAHTHNYKEMAQVNEKLYTKLRESAGLDGWMGRRFIKVKAYFKVI